MDGMRGMDRMTTHALPILSIPFIPSMYVARQPFAFASFTAAVSAGTISNTSPTMP